MPGPERRQSANGILAQRAIVRDMCGISGILTLSGCSGVVETVKAMNLQVAHRGPDDEGIVVFGDDGVLDLPSGNKCHRAARGRPGFTGALGHRRLSIIDLSPAGHQPMHDSNGRYWIVFNGEVYNYLELREELQKLGHRFRSQTDTEVVLTAYTYWGKDCLKRFNGMWAFAIYDREDQRLFCARDRFGIKPFHYAIEPGRFAFGSEAKQLLTMPWVDRRSNCELLADFFLWGFSIHTSGTCFAGIHCLPPGHSMMITLADVETGAVRAQRYWRPKPGGTETEDQAVDAFRTLFVDSVRLRLRSDVPVGVTLSGGLDSSSVVCAAGETRRRRGAAETLRAFTVEFEDEGYSEAAFAAAAAKKAEARHIMLRPSREDLRRDWDRFTWHMETPIDGLSYFSNFQIYRLIREHGVPVILSGQGGDELLLGYERYRSYNVLFQLRSMRLGQLLQEIYLARHHANMGWGKQAAYFAYFSWPALRAARRRRVVERYMRRDFFRQHSGRIDHLVRCMHPSNRQQLQENEFFAYQLPHLLHFEDRASMAHSVETRLPFLDYRLLEFVLGQPLDLLFRQGWSKYILRKAMRGLLPEAVEIRRDKMGYDTPTRRLIRENREVFLPLLQRHPGDSVLDTEAVIRDFDSPRIHENFLCGAVSYLSWKEMFTAPDSVEA
jgi:asparagine synthase (glutamine-hydrolysing)